MKLRDSISRPLTHKTTFSICPFICVILQLDEPVVEVWAMCIHMMDKVQSDTGLLEAGIAKGC